MNKFLCLITSVFILNSGCSTDKNIKNELADTIDLSIEQSGRNINIIDDIAEIRRTKFLITFKFSQPDSILINASFLSETYNNAKAGLPLNELTGFKETGIAEELFNKESIIYLSNNSPNFWYYSDDTDHRFNNILKTGNSYLCTREVSGLIDLDTSVERIDISKIRQNEIYLVVIKSEWNRDYTSMIEKNRKIIKLKFII